MSDTIHQPSVLELTAQIVSGHASNNTVAAQDLPAIIAYVHQALTQVGNPASPVAEKKEPFVHPKKSVFPEYIVCLEDGRKLKMLKRYLHSTFGLTPDEYRAKWGLSKDYPMVAPAYSAKRTALAKSIGLGRKRNAGG